MLKLENVCAGYGKLDVLWDVSCEVHDGEFVAIVGPNGAGKTTTMRAISGLVRPKSGAIIFNGEHLEGESMKRIHDLGVSFITDDGKPVFRYERERKPADGGTEHPEQK